MTIYAIGSIDGHFSALRKCLDDVGFDPATDRLWLTGNLVGAGLESLEVLRYVKGLGKSAVCVLGNQDLELLMQAAGFSPAQDSHRAVLEAPDRDELLNWLRRRGLIHHDSKLNYTLVHSGIPAEWTRSQMLTFAYEVESVLSQSNYLAFLENRKQDQSRWHAKLRGWKRLNYIANALTQMRYCTEQGKMDFQARGPVSEQAAGLMPWYRLPDRPTASQRVVFADDAGFQDEPFTGAVPLPAVGDPSALRALDTLA
ncbi:symmetrical bis(5'-nucleosyl)-tetraphosphatase [Methylomonas sp. MED-D]|uniref:symmetrical bis(5'-nucleosyl)-tetraphosphatase n=1 Tax=Methylomonas sp. MED-D TaxID=3418768 RepID=UPI003D058FC2